MMVHKVFTIAQHLILCSSMDDNDDNLSICLEQMEYMKTSARLIFDWRMVPEQIYAHVKTVLYENVCLLKNSSCDTSSIKEN